MERFYENTSTRYLLVSNLIESIRERGLRSLASFATSISTPVWQRFEVADLNNNTTYFNGLSPTMRDFCLTWARCTTFTYTNFGNWMLANGHLPTATISKALSQEDLEFVTNESRKVFGVERGVAVVVREFQSWNDADQPEWGVLVGTRHGTHGRSDRLCLPYASIATYDKPETAARAICASQLGLLGDEVEFKDLFDEQQEVLFKTNPAQGEPNEHVIRVYDIRPSHMSTVVNFSNVTITPYAWIKPFTSSIVFLSNPSNITFTQQEFSLEVINLITFDNNPVMTAVELATDGFRHGNGKVSIGNVTLRSAVQVWNGGVPSPGNAGEVLTSGGASLPCTWQPAASALVYPNTVNGSYGLTGNILMSTGNGTPPTWYLQGPRGTINLSGGTGNLHTFLAQGSQNMLLQSNGSGFDPSFTSSININFANIITVCQAGALSSSSTCSSNSFDGQTAIFDTQMTAGGVPVSASPIEGVAVHSGANTVEVANFHVSGTAGSRSNILFDTLNAGGRRLTFGGASDFMWYDKTASQEVLKLVPDKGAAPNAPESFLLWNDSVEGTDAIVGMQKSTQHMLVGTRNSRDVRMIAGNLPRFGANSAGAFGFGFGTTLDYGTPGYVPMCRGANSNTKWMPPVAHFVEYNLDGNALYPNVDIDNWQLLPIGNINNFELAWPNGVALTAPVTQAGAGFQAAAPGVWRIVATFTVYTNINVAGNAYIDLQTTRDGWVTTQNTRRLYFAQSQSSGTAATILTVSATMHEMIRINDVALDQFKFHGNINTVGSFVLGGIGN
jgi:hypothetical protein